MRGGHSGRSELWALPASVGLSLSVPRNFGGQVTFRFSVARVRFREQQGNLIVGHLPDQTKEFVAVGGHIVDRRSTSRSIASTSRTHPVWPALDRLQHRDVVVDRID
jgi:hypothetical protein